MHPVPILKVAVFVSGRGSNLAALLEAKNRLFRESPNVLVFENSRGSKSYRSAERDYVPNRSM